MFKILNFEELQAYIRSNLRTEISQEGKSVKIEMFLNGEDGDKKFYIDQIELSLDPFMDELRGEIRDIVSSMMPPAQPDTSEEES